MRRGAVWGGVAIGAAVSVAMIAPPADATSSAPARAVNAAVNGQAGYELLKPGASTSASVTFKVPALKCTSALAGIGLGATVFTGKQGLPTSSNVFATCQSGKSVYYAALEANGGATVFATFSPQAGDTVAVSVAESTTASRLTIKDLNQGKSKAISGGGGADSFILLGIDRLANNKGVRIPIPNFGTTGFSKGKEGDRTPKAAGAIAVNCENSSRVVQVFTAPLGGTGDSWSEAFRHS
jgi:hypothetical protein